MDAPQHSREFRLRRFANWFPLGITYACLYMGRYNFNVVKGTMGGMFHLDKAQMGIIATAGFWTYALSLIINGPLTDKIGGRRAILFGASGAALLNLTIGLVFLNDMMTKIIVGMSLLYAVNMYFQSFGAVAVVKANAPWFHRKERGTFGGIFGIMISSGYFLAMTVGGWILASFPWYTVFLIPAALIACMVIVDWFLVRDRPSHAGHPDFDTADASSGDATPVNRAYLMHVAVKRPAVRILAAAEFCTGFVRQGLLLYFVEYLKEVHHVVVGTATFSWASGGTTIGGIAGGLLCGWMSDKLFAARRPPAAFVFYLCQIPALLLVGYAPGPGIAAFSIGFACTWIFGVHGILSGTASMDFGGQKAAATVTGMLDGIQYVASGLTGFGLGWVLKTYGWDGTPLTNGYQPHDAHVWVMCIIPFSIMGAILMTRIWNEQPQTRKR